jgi:membrane protease YdiL (CAAX protease family)
VTDSQHGEAVMNVLVLISLLIVLVALVWYVRDGARAMERLRVAQEPAQRLAFFRRKLLLQWLLIVALPALALWITGLLPLAFNPAEVIAPASALASSTLCIEATDFGPSHAAGVITGLMLAIILLEAVPVLLGSRKVVMVGDVKALLPRSWGEALPMSGLAVGAGLGEEMLFRALLPLGLLQLGVPIVAGLVIAALIFGACHYYQGKIGMIFTTVFGLVFAAIYAVTQNLWTVIILHAGIDLVAAVVRPMLRRSLQSMRDRLTTG